MLIFNDPHLGRFLANILHTWYLWSTLIGDIVIPLMKFTLLEGQGHYDILLFFLHNSLLFFNDPHLRSYLANIPHIWYLYLITLLRNLVTSGEIDFAWRSRSKVKVKSFKNKTIDHISIAIRLKDFILDINLQHYKLRLMS